MTTCCTTKNSYDLGERVSTLMSLSEGAEHEKTAF